MAHSRDIHVLEFCARRPARCDRSYIACIADESRLWVEQAPGRTNLPACSLDAVAVLAIAKVIRSLA